MKAIMTNRLACALTLCVLSLPLVGCSSGDDDAANTTPGTWADKTYLLTVTKTQWTIPRGIGSEIDGYVPSFIMKVDASGTSMLLGTAEPNATPENAKQDMCSPTFTFPFTASYPKMDLGPLPMRIHIVNPAENAGEDSVQETGDVFDLTMKDVLPNGSTPSDSGVFTATMDFTQLAPLFTALGNGADKDGVCSALYDEFHTYPGGMCSACPTSDAHPYCLTITGEQVGAVEAPSVALVPVDEASRPATCNPEKFQ